MKGPPSSAPILGMSVVLRGEPDGPVIATETVMGRDLVEAIGEVCFEAGPLQGRSISDPDALEVRLLPARRHGSRQAGRSSTQFLLTARAPGALPVERRFARGVLGPVARRCADRLIDEGVLERGDPYDYELEVVEGELDPRLIAGAQLLEAPETAPIAPLLARARRVRGDSAEGERDEIYARDPNGPARGGKTPSVETGPREGARSPHHPVFYRAEALRRAEQVARGGAAETPPVETGGLLIGRQLWCPESQTFYSVIDDVIEASGSEATTYSLTFTPETWARLGRVLRARRAQPGAKQQRILGQCHGHSFLPFDFRAAGGSSCDGCGLQSRCEFTTAYLSDADRAWCRAVFSLEPTQLSHIFGLTPRREPVDAFYGQRGGVLERRDYYVLGGDDA